MSLPSRCLVRRRGGKTAAQRLKAKLKFVGSAARALVGGGLLLPAAPLEPVSHTRADEAKSEADRRRVQLLSARQLARRGHYRKKLQRIVGRDMAETTLPLSVGCSSYLRGDYQASRIDSRWC